jgi:hypothetical protein
VREVLDATDRLAERVIGGAVREVHRETGREACAREAAARLRVGTVRDGGRQGVRDVMDGLEAERDRERRRVRDRAGTDRLRHRVDPGVRGRSRGEPVGEDGIDERFARACHGRPIPVALVSVNARAETSLRARRRPAEDEVDVRRHGCPGAVRRRAQSHPGRRRSGGHDVERGPPMPTTAPRHRRTRAASSSWPNVSSPDADDAIEPHPGCLPLRAATSGARRRLDDDGALAAPSPERVRQRVDGAIAEASDRQLRMEG